MKKPKKPTQIKDAFRVMEEIAKDLDKQFQLAKAAVPNPAAGVAPVPAPRPLTSEERIARLEAKLQEVIAYHNNLANGIIAWAKEVSEKHNELVEKHNSLVIKHNDLVREYGSHTHYRVDLGVVR